jgi:hypothetical protein
MSESFSAFFACWLRIPFKFNNLRDTSLMSATKGFLIGLRGSRLTPA